MEIVIIIVLAVLLAALGGFFIWDRFRGRRMLKEQSEAMSKVLDEKIADNVRIFGDVRERLGELTQRTKEIQDVGKNISSLQDLLRAPKFRGCFGELLLERLLADVLPQDTYSLQYRFRDGQIADAVVRIGKNLVPIDAKFPMEDFERMVKEESENERSALRRQFVRTVKKHIDAVSKYILPDEDTFDFALMYLPAENIYYEAIIHDTQSGEGSDIYTHSLEKRVIPVSPNSFYAYLQVIVLGLKGLRFEQAAQEILGYVKRLQGDLGDFEQEYAVLGSHLRHAAGKYETASRRLERLGDKLRLVGENPVAGLPEMSTEVKSEDFDNEPDQTT
jgi:DNA recombination protein RmuC